MLLMKTIGALRLPLRPSCGVADLPCEGGKGGSRLGLAENSACKTVDKKRMTRHSILGNSTAVKK